MIVTYMYISFILTLIKTITVSSFEIQSLNAEHYAFLGT